MRRQNRLGTIVGGGSPRSLAPFATTTERTNHVPRTADIFTRYGQGSPHYGTAPLTDRSVSGKCCFSLSERQK
jgi:hypothetical protein